jgi:tryptophan synthase
LGFIKEARARGLKAPVLLMGYYNTTLAYGEQLAVQHAKEAGANGFIVVDLPPEEAVSFREICTSEGSVLAGPLDGDMLTAYEDSAMYR